MQRSHPHWVCRHVSAGYMCPVTHSLLTNSSSVASLHGLQARRRKREQMAAGLDAAFQQYQLLRHGCSSFAADAVASTSLQRHLVRTRGADIADGILQYQVGREENPPEPIPSCLQEGPSTRRAAMHNTNR